MVRLLQPASLLVLSLLLVACDDKPITVDDTDETGQDSPPEDTDDTEPTVVWQDLRAESSDTFNGVYASGRGVYVVSSESGLYTYTASTAWTAEELAVDEEDLNGIWGQGQGETLEYVLVGDAGWIVEFDGTDTAIEDLGTANFEAVDSSGTDFLVAVGWGGAYTSDGISWTYETLPDHERLNDVWVAGTSAIAVGEEGAIVRREGSTWVAMESPTDQALYGVDGAADNDLWAVGQDGTVLHFEGSVWSEVEAFTSQSLWAVYAPSTSSVYVVGNNGSAYHYNGTAWRTLPTGVEENLYAVHGASTDDCWAVGNRGTALHYTGG